RRRDTNATILSRAEMPTILAFAEVRDGVLRAGARDALAAAGVLAEATSAEVEAIVIGGAGAGAVAEQLGPLGAARVRVAEVEGLGQYSAGAFLGVVADVVRSADYLAVVFPGSAMGKDLAPRLAARL